VAVASPSRSPRSAQVAAAAKVSPEEKLVASLVALLEAGTTPWQREWDAASGGHHVNLLSGRRYRGANPALLTLGMHLRGAALPYWCGFAEAKALGIFPRKGSKAVHVLRPQVHQLGEGQLAESGSAGKGGHGSAGANGQPSVQPGRSWVSYRPVALFNAADLVLDVADLMGPDCPSETFRVLKTNEIRQFGEYRTQGLVLEAWDRLFGGW